MVIILVAARYQRIMEWLHTCPSSRVQAIELIKQNGPKLFLYVQTQECYQDIVQLFKQTIQCHGGMTYVYQFYQLYNGMIDYNAYLSETTKNQMKYYQSQNKDLSQQELQTFLQKS